MSGHPALDFCNTRAGWDTAAPKEYLLSYRHAVLWTREAGLLSRVASVRLIALAAQAPGPAQHVLLELLALREAAYRVALGSRSPAEYAVVDAHARAARAATVLRPAAKDSSRLGAWVLAEDRVETPLLAVAGQVEQFLCSPLSGVVGVCAGPGCGWLFADPHRRRRWCEMAVCGNRAKARRYAERLAGRHAERLALARG
ncbi:MAG: CGNR zinc finger domain-containing protein [Mycobacteriales bacterium]